MTKQVYPLGSVSPMRTAMELKCVVAKPILRYLEAEVGRHRMMQIIAESAMNLDYLENADNWISYSYYTGLLQRLVVVTGDPMSPFKACQRFTNRESFQAIISFLRHVGTPRESYRLLVRCNSLWNRISDWSLVRIGTSECVVDVKFGRHKQTRENCLAIQGALTVVPREYNLPYADVKEKACACESGDVCRYEITWKNRPWRSIMWRISGLVAGIVLGVVVTRMTAQVIVVWTAVLGFCLGWVLDCWRQIDDAYLQSEEQATALWKSIRDREKMNEDLQTQVMERTDELELANMELNKALVDLQASRERELQAEQQATVGVVAGGMAHELNSPLNAVRMSLQELAEELPKDSPLQSSVAVAERASGRCKRIINDLLVCSREPRLDLMLKMGNIVKDVVQLFAREHPTGVTIAMHCAADLPDVELDMIQMQHVVMNLLKNATDAMGSEGTVDVSLSGSEGRVVLRVSDRGPGVPAKDKEEIFKPLHSTKPGRGLGLGLSITRQLVWRNGGSISVLDREGGGAVFEVVFPVKKSGGRAQ